MNEYTLILNFIFLGIAILGLFFLDEHEYAYKQIETVFHVSIFTSLYSIMLDYFYILEEDKNTLKYKCFRLIKNIMEIFSISLNLNLALDMFLTPELYKMNHYISNLLFLYKMKGVIKFMTFICYIIS